MFIDHFKGIHITRNKRGKVWRYTFHFPSGVVFHSSKRKYSRRELQTIERGSRKLEQQHKEGYSVAPNPPEPQP